jgi:hypothetical protein
MIPFEPSKAVAQVVDSFRQPDHDGMATNSR